MYDKATVEAVVRWARVYARPPSQYGITAQTLRSIEWHILIDAIEQHFLTEGEDDR